MPKNSEKITLSNFVNMKENKLVEVTFKEKQKENKIVKQVVKVPPTSKDSQNDYEMTLKIVYD